MASLPENPQSVGEASLSSSCRPAKGQTVGLYRQNVQDPPQVQQAMSMWLG